MDMKGYEKRYELKYGKTTNLNIKMGTIKLALAAPLAC